MVAARQIRCVVIETSAETVDMPRFTQPRFRPSDLLPWSDPYIRSLVEQLQQEVREDNARRAAERAANPEPAIKPVRGC
jgi:hypothetical protein